jgi:DNA-binding XRE family transcriptional regulator
MDRRADVARRALVSEDEVVAAPMEQVRTALATRLSPGVLAEMGASPKPCIYWRVGGSYYWDNAEWGPVVNVEDLRYDEERGLVLDTQVQERRLYGLHMRKRRLALVLSQNALAQTLGVSIDAVQDWEQGRRLPRMRKLIEQELGRLEEEANTPTGYFQGVPMYTRPNRPTPESLGGEPLHPDPA